RICHAMGSPNDRLLRLRGTGGPMNDRTDAVLNGTLIGAGIGAVPGIYWLIAVPNECAGLCAEDYVAIGVGAVVGALVDRAIRRRVTVYEFPVGGRPGTVAIVPLAGARAGLQVAVRF